MAWNEKQLQLLDVAEKLFATNGYEGTSVRDIAQEAGVNVAMISYYFGSKEKLLQNLILQRTERTSAILKELSRDDSMGPLEKINRIVDYYVDRMLDNRDFHTIMNRQISMAQDREIMDLLIEVKEQNSAMISEIIREGQRKNKFRNVNIPLTIGTVMGTISQVSMSRPFYCRLLKLDEQNDKDYFKKIRSKLKTHLKALLRSHLTGEGV
jgi:AcrR family transcriptional regulator